MAKNDQIVDILDLTSGGASREEILQTLSRMIWADFVMDEMAPRLSKEDAESLQGLIKSDDSGEKILKFLENKLPDFKQLLRQKGKKLRSELVRERIWELAEKYKTDGEKQKLLKEAARGLEEGDLAVVGQKLVVVGN